MKKFTAFFVLLTATLLADEGISQASDYRKNSDIQWQLAIDNLAGFNFEKTDAVLDVGCGDGKITDYVAEKVPDGQVVGLDISEKMIVEASSLFKKDHLTFIQGNAAEIPFKNQFDKVISFNVLHWVLEQEKALQSMRESLKEGGSILLVVPGSFANNSGVLGEKVALSEKWRAYFPSFKRQRVYYTPEQYQNLLQEAGFQIETFEVLESAAPYPNRAALSAWIAPLMNFTTHLSESQRKEFVEDMTDEMLLVDPPAPDGTIKTRYIMFRIIAKK
jgi:trans-aconitate methyltransferase